MSSIPLTTEALAPLSLHSPAHLRVQLSQTAHRLNIVRAWTGASTSSPTPDPSAQDDGQASAPWTYDFAGKKVLEIGCGQGDMTAVLAAHVSRKEGGNVTAMDPAPLDYGQSPHSPPQRRACPSGTDV